MTNKELDKIKLQAQANNPWQFIQDILFLIYNGVDFSFIEIYLDGGRKYGKTYNACDLVAIAIILAAGQLDAYLLRWMKGDSNELALETIDAVERNLGAELNKKELNKSSKTFTINHNKLRVMGLHTPSSRKNVKLTGIKRAKGKKYAIVVLEEAYEFTVKEMNDIKHAIGGYKNFIFIYITNPNSLAYPFIAAREKEFPHNEKELRTKGYQFKIDYKPNHTRIWFYANWRINQHIELADVNLILDTWKTDPSRARVVDYGMPGIEDNGIYAYEYPKIRRITVQELLTKSFKKVSGGIDWGDGSGETSSATVAVLTFQDYDDNTFCLPLYYHHNKDGYKTPQQRCKEIMFQYARWSEIKNDLKWNNLTIYMDTGLYAEKEILEIERAQHDLYWIDLRFANKFQERTRINMRKFRINTGKYYVIDENEELYSQFMNEIQLQVWDETKRDKQNLPKQKDAFNHFTDAEDYSICEETYLLAENKQFQLTYKKW